MLKYCMLVGCFLAFLGAALVAGGLYYLVVVNPGPEIETAYIEDILGRESQVYFQDNTTKLGVLFEGIHRQYLGYRDIPPHFVNAIVAAEDDEFFSHFGVDIPGIIRAMVANLKAGRVVQGGSTLTQQTAKNLFKRESRSYKAKLKELLFALRLEYRYPKEKILEFYSNQFFVSGNGHGLGVAARYYFNKEPAALDLLECAFIAGSVKRPNYYNPFTTWNQAHPAAARKKVDQRLGYVLAKMLKAGTITPEQYAAAKERDLIFDRGKMAYRLNTAMDMVRDGLRTQLVSQALEEHGIYNVATSGIRVITTLDQEIQRRTLYALRSHLSGLDVRLRGYDRRTVQEEYAALDYKGDRELLPGAFVFGTILEIADQKQQGAVITVSLGREDGARAVIDEAGLERMVEALAKNRNNRWSTAAPEDRKALLRQLQPGDQVYLSLKEEQEQTAASDLEDAPLLQARLERYPQVEGGVLALQKGAIRAMAGGMQDRFFNRAVDARRLMGSTFKPFVFAAAMQLGWSAVDILDNRRDVFVFMGHPYFPRPDHHSPHERVSMSWAGVSSENVAAVWLLYHLADHLTPPRLRELAQQLDMAPRRDGEQEEGYQQFRRRIRDDFGVVVSRETLREAAFTKAKQALRADFLFDDDSAGYEQLKRLHYGLGFGRFQEELAAAQKAKGLRSREKAELKLRLRLLESSYLSLAEVYQGLTTLRSQVEQAVHFSGSSPAWQQPFPGSLVQDGQGRVIYTFKKELPEGWMVWPMEQVVSFVATLNSAQKLQFWEELQLEGVVTLSAYQRLKEQVAREEAALAGSLPYSLEVLGHVRDYRVMLGLRYLVRLGERCGLSSKLEPVLSFPLGSNVITLVEAVRMYETLVTGKRYQPIMPREASEEQEETAADLAGLAIIQRIEAPDGELIYQQQMSAEPVFDAKTAAATSHILENTVQHGTGRYARRAVRLHSVNPEREQGLAELDLPVPLLGKTGTANGYRNASFLGYVPVLQGENEALMQLDQGYSLGVYTGYDTNESMVKGTNRVSGAMGALPIWSEVAEALLARDGVGERLDLVDLTFNGLQLRYPPVDQVFVRVQPKQGGLLPSRGSLVRRRTPGRAPVSLSYGTMASDGQFEPRRYFRPYWANIPERNSPEGALSSAP
ncbi:transglycosylase domain-containing protein [Desulfogranum mediterraneum]|uniref:transglycosylase domain-containing protein n=1 Tax=Desulfogranum mediterraneum TaxID=160661 RepID=UPI001378D622|nr:transglycosylase domain-containing protein [Desulfogranum mediterraneum]